MILHTIVPIDQLHIKEEDSPYEYRTADGMVLQGIEENGKFTISRVISTDPKKYLDPRLLPGKNYNGK